MDSSDETNSITPEPKKINTKNVLSRIKRRVLKHYKAVRILIVAVVFLFAFLLFQLVSFVLDKTPISYYKNLATTFILAPTEKLLSHDNRVNILILGKGGPNHTAPDLTDTMLFASINLNSGNIFMLSLPRDIWISSLRAKLNSAYYWGNQKEKTGGGLILAKSEVEKIVGQPVHYGMVFDFGAFKNIIDVLGGVEVDVQNGFVDEKFPITGRENDLCDGDLTYACRYETLKFEKGVQVMDGETALKFVRSRNAEGDEGTDLAREARQQRVISGVKKKLLDPKTLLNYKKVKELLNVINSSIETDMDTEKLTILVRKLLGTDSQKSEIIPEEFLIHPQTSAIYDNQYVFIPAAKSAKVGEENWSELQKWIQEKLNEN